MTVSKLARILVVDDEKDICTIIARGLRLAGFDVESSVSAVDAISKFKAGIYDLVMLDIKMPEMDGIELYGKIRSVDKEVKICFLTAFDSNFRSRFRQEYPYDEVPEIIRKPVGLTKLIQEIKTQIDIQK